MLPAATLACLSTIALLIVAGIVQPAVITNDAACASSLLSHPLRVHETKFTPRIRGGGASETGAEDVDHQAGPTAMIIEKSASGGSPLSGLRTEAAAAPPGSQGSSAEGDSPSSGPQGKIVAARSAQSNS